jgi:ribosomal protein S18 acetylase RimI-like enzyme
MIRAYQHGDHVAIAEIFTRAIHEVASSCYTPAQCLAWSDRKPNPAHWEQRCETKRPLVYVVNGDIAGFLEVDPDGHLDCLYVHPSHGRRGIATELVRHAVDACFAKGLSRVYVEASHCARPLFEKLGFATLHENRVRIGDQELVNYSMELRSTASRETTYP